MRRLELSEICITSALILLLSDCSLMTPKSGRPIDPATYESLIPGRTSQLEVRSAIGYSPPGTRYEKTGQIDIYVTQKYSAKNYIPGYVLVTGITNLNSRLVCTIWWFQYDANNILSRKWIDHGCTNLDTKPLPAAVAAAPPAAMPPNSAPIVRTADSAHPTAANCPALGIDTTRLAVTSFGSGVMIASVSPRSAAADAGIRPGDILLQVGDSAINDPADVQNALCRISPGAPTDMKLSRQAQPMWVSVRF
jgi:membrane-associated protease RseP (regulator of RpoE activity)